MQAHLHCEQEARRELRARRSSVKQRGRRVREVALRHELVRLNGSIDIGLVDTDGDAHVHLLRTLANRTVVDFQQV